MVRFKNRYFLFDIIFDNPPQTSSSSTQSSEDTGLKWNEKIIAKHIRDSLQLLYGDYGFALCAQSIQVKYYNPYTTLCIMRVARDHAIMISQLLALSTVIQQIPCTIHVIHVSGTIRNCQRQAVEYDRRFILESKQALIRQSQSKAAQLAIAEQQAHLLAESEQKIGALDV